MNCPEVDNISPKKFNSPGSFSGSELDCDSRQFMDSYEGNESNNYPGISVKISL